MDERTINALCEKFHTTVDYLIPTYSHYAITKDIWRVIICILLIIVSCVVIKLCYKYEGKNYSIKPRLEAFDTGTFFATIAAALICVCTVIALFIRAYDLTLWITNPEMRFFEMVLSINN